jgi:PERQ amino acid-rich with GYF domain-containing protein
MPSSMTWGLPTSKGSVPPPSSSTPPTPAWGGGSEGPKKTLKQIQEEEERRNQKLARQHQAAVAASTPAAKRGYADLAATHAPTPAQAAAAAAAGWTTVGAGGKTAAAPVKPAAPLPAKPVAAVKPAAVVAKPAAKPPVADEQPSIEFIRWTKQALTGLSVPVDDFISMLLSFPVDPPASSRAEVQEIIADSVYASSSTLDGRRFAAEFMTRRKADAKRDTSKPVAKIGSLADVVKTQAKAPAADVGFKVVKAKKKRS